MEDKALKSILENYSMCFKKYMKICDMLCDNYCLLNAWKKDYWFSLDTYEGGMICIMEMKKDSFYKEILFPKEWLFESEEKLQVLIQQLIQGIISA